MNLETKVYECSQLPILFSACTHIGKFEIKHHKEYLKVLKRDKITSVYLKVYYANKCAQANVTLT